MNDTAFLLLGYGVHGVFNIDDLPPWLFVLKAWFRSAAAPAAAAALALGCSSSAGSSSSWLNRRNRLLRVQKCTQQSPRLLLAMWLALFTSSQLEFDRRLIRSTMPQRPNPNPNTQVATMATSSRADRWCFGCGGGGLGPIVVVGSSVVVVIGSSVVVIGSCWQC